MFLTSDWIKNLSGGKMPPLAVRLDTPPHVCHTMKVGLLSLAGLCALNLTRVRRMSRRTRDRHIGVGAWPSGKAVDFGSTIPGSNPGAPATSHYSAAVYPPGSEKAFRTPYHSMRQHTTSTAADRSDGEDQSKPPPEPHANCSIWESAPTPLRRKAPGVFTRYCFAATCRYSAIEGGAHLYG